MTQEEKDLLLKDICSRFPYGVKCKYYDHYEGAYDEGTIRGFERHEYMEIDGVCIHVEEVKPYLFPLSSMTEEQERQYSFFSTIIFSCFEVDLCEAVAEFNDWLNRNHFDYRNLIDKSLALDATNLGIYE